MIAILFTLVFVLNFVYLFAFRNLMTQLERHATEYWNGIGRPNSFSGNHVMAILSNLYTTNMADACSSMGRDRLLVRVRIMLPLTFVCTGLLLFYIALQLPN